MSRNNGPKTIKEKLDGNQKVTAVFYARTSTSNDEQKDSCDNQVAMCDIYLKQHPNLVLLEPPYVDKGISGKSNLKRLAYQKMIERLKEGDVDLLIVKTNARICRSKSIASSLEELMRDYNFSILTLSDGQIYDYTDRSSRLINGIKEIMDEDYVWGQSEYGKMTHKLRCEKKILTNCQVVYGYRWNKEKKAIEIEPDESQIIKQMFEWYVFEDLGVSKIAKRMGEMGVYGKYSNNLVNSRTITNWLENPCYAGTFYINKRGSLLDLGVNRNTKRFALPREEWIAVSRPDLAIISKEMFDMAQKLRESKRTIYDKPSNESAQARFKGFHLFAGKVFCGECNTQFVFGYSDRKKTIGVYKDYFSKKAKRTTDVCNNAKYKKIYEETLIEATKKAINIFLENKEEVFTRINDLVEECLNNQNASDIKKITIEKRKEKEEININKLMDAWANAPDDEMKRYFYTQISEARSRLFIVEDELIKLTSIKDKMLEVQMQMFNVKERLEKVKHINEIDRNIIETFIDKIIINKDGKMDVFLKVGQKYTEIIEAKQPRKKGAALPSNWSIKLKNNVGKMCKQDMMDQFQQHMLIPQETFWQGLRLWL